MATTIVSVRKDVPERTSEPMSRKLMVSCPLAKAGSMVGRGATVLTRKFGSGVGVSVWTIERADEDDDWEDESITGAERGEPVGVQGMGWKGVRVGDAFGADVTIANGNVCDCCVGALLTHPASNRAARMIFQ